jgi:hypothetical protein
MTELTLLAALLFGGPGGFAPEQKVELSIRVDDPRGTALPCRIHLSNAEGKPQQAAGLPFWKDHFVCDGRVTLSLVPGKYRYEIERGPEHQRSTGTLELKAGRDHTLSVQLGRVADLARSGWYSGDLHVHRPVADMELLMRAEDLHIAPVITWWNSRNLWANRDLPRGRLHQFDGNRFYHVMAGEDERGGGALLFFHLDEPLPIDKADRESPAALTFAAEARRRNKQVWIDIEKPFWWDVPVWLASGQMDSIGLANNHMCRSQMSPTEAWGRPRDEKLLPPPLGNGQWTQQIYYHALNAGLRLPPSAGSASGVLPNPVGYNRVYVHVEGELTYANWWAGLKAGRCFVTNGPLLLVTANGKLPGHVFEAAEGNTVEIKLDLSLWALDRVPAIEVVRDGAVVETVKVDGAGTAQATARLQFTQSGWFLVRALTDKKDTFRFASTGPFYVAIGKTDRRIARKSVQFFLDWIDERMERLKAALPDGKQRAAVLQTQEDAYRYWKKLLQSAADE